MLFRSDAVDSHSAPCTRANFHADVAAQPTLLKPIIKPWEELVHNKHKTGLGYDKDVSFHIPDYTNPIIFQSVGFLYDSSPAVVPDPVLLPQQQQIVKFQHCDRVGHMKDQCFYLHPCKHCGRHTHSSNKCFKTSLLQEQRFILDGSLLGNGHQQPRKFLGHVSELVLKY